MRKSLSYDELLGIASSLEDYHKVFYTWWEMSDISFTDDELKTAGVHLVDHNGQVLDKPSLLINQDFWNRHNHRERLFIVLHECLHVILDHGERDGSEVEGATPDLANKAQDITINEMIVDVFGYDRDDLKEWKDYCWIDTCFDDPRSILHGETFTYYLELLVKQAKEGKSGKGAGKIFDVHPPAPGEPGADGKPTDPSKENDARISVAEKLADDLSPEEIETIIKSFPESLTARAMVGKLEMLLGTKKTTQLAKLKFGTVIKRLKRTRFKPMPVDTETFSRDNRRFDDIIRSSNATLPGKGERDKPVKDRLLTALFMDISGSCVNYFGAFQRVFLAFDAEREIFETRLFTFDTSVMEIFPGDRIYGGGGTAFHILEEKVQELKNEYRRYPDCVVVITDGEGNKIIPEVPKNWIWLLTDRYDTRYIPTASRWFTIKQVTF